MGFRTPLSHLCLLAAFFCTAPAAARALAGALGAMGGEVQAGAEVQAGYVEVSGGRLYYEAAGNGPVVVLLHDGILHGETWSAQFSRFSRDYRVVRYDRRGYGRSPGASRTYTDVEDLEAIFTALKIDRAALVGSSAGGGLAIDFTLVHPQLVSSLVLVGAVVGGLPSSDHFASRGGRWTAAQQSGDLKSVIDYWAMRDPYYVAAKHPEVKARVKALLEANPQNLKHDGFLRHSGGPALGRLPAIRVPALIVVGEDDIPDVHAHAGAIQAGIAGSTRIVVRDAGHLVQLEQPDAFNALVLDFLKAPPPPHGPK